MREKREKSIFNQHLNVYTVKLGAKVFCFLSSFFKDIYIAFVNIVDRIESGTFRKPSAVVKSETSRWIYSTNSMAPSGCDLKSPFNFG